MKEFLKFSFGCFGIHVVIILAVIIFFKVRYSWETSVNSFYVNKLGRYKEAKELIIDNLELIKKELSYQPYDTIKYDDGSFYVSKNEFITSLSERDFENYQAQEKLLSIKSIKKLWENDLLISDWNGITIRSNQNVEFHIKEYANGSFFSHYRHYLVFAKNQEPELFLVDNHNNSYLLYSESLEKDWHYLVIEYIPD